MTVLKGAAANHNTAVGDARLESNLSISHGHSVLIEFRTAVLESTAPDAAKKGEEKCAA